MTILNCCQGALCAEDTVPLTLSSPAPCPAGAACDKPVRRMNLSLQKAAKPQEIVFLCGGENLVNLNSFRTDYSLCF
jgi:hypothetical protein